MHFSASTMVSYLHIFFYIGAEIAGLHYILGLNLANYQKKYAGTAPSNGIKTNVFNAESALFWCK